MRQTVETIDKEAFEQVWKIALEIGVQERHFNGLQTSYRSMASAWLLATFAGIGFSISQPIHVAIDRELLVAAIAVAGCVGIALLWVLDLLVYHRLLDSCFIEGLILEERYAWLPAFRNNMMKTQEGQGVLFRTVGFYLAPVVLLIFIAGGALGLWLYREEHPLAATASVVVSVIVAVLAGMAIRSKTENTSVLEKRLAAARKSK
jgi:hypothetical protein